MTDSEPFEECVKRDYESLLPRLLERLFPDPVEHAEAIRLLNASGNVEPYQVRVGILRLSGNDFEAIKQWSSLAAGDWRDLLGPAEYPRTKKGRSIYDWRDTATRQAAIRAEQKRYDRWIESVLGADEA